MQTVTVDFNQNKLSVELPFTSGQFKIRDIEIKEGINYDWYRIYFSYKLNKKSNQSKMLSLPFKGEINRAETHYSFPIQKVDDYCVKNTVSLLLTIQAETSGEYNPLDEPDITITIDYDL